jgi:hypothetical protein
MSVTVEDIVAALFWRATRSGARIARAPTEPVNRTARVLVFDVLGSDHTDRGARLRCGEKLMLEVEGQEP